jgi:hypothetical protein
LLYASAVVLLLSLVAPSLWRAMSTGPTPVKPAIDAPPKRELLAHSVIVQPQEEATEEESDALAVAEPEIDWEPEAAVVSGRRDLALVGEPIVPQVAEVRPPVAERIELDPSLAEAQDLPTKRPTPEVEHPHATPSPEPEDPEAPLPPPIERAPAILPPASGGVWPHAEMLVRQMHMLAEESPADAAWARQVELQLDTLVGVKSLSSPDVADALENLHRLAGSIGVDDAGPQPPSRARTLRLRAMYGITRRLALWDLVAELAAAGNPPRTLARLDAPALMEALDGIEDVMHGSRAAPSWRAYLRMNELREIAGSNSLTAEQREVVRDVLQRLHSPRLDKAQHTFARQTPFCQLDDTLKAAAQDPVDWVGLLDHLERHETFNSEIDAQHAASIYQVMRWSNDERLSHLAYSLNENYRNANVRLAISAELLNRFVPPPQVMAEPVNDNIRGADVFGHSQAVTRLRIVLLPDRFRWKMGLEAQGSVASETESAKGPARFWNDGLGHFNARKIITLDRRGLGVARAQTSASADSYLRDFETNFDPIPLFGQLARSIAENQYNKEQPAARSEIEEKISQRASQRLDQEVDQRILQAEQEFKRKLIAPLDRLNLEPTPVDMETTARRLIVRYRLASPLQLSANTPRPQAPGNSMVSLQLHQSMMNNSLENLQLDNRRVELRKLYVEMLQRFGATDIKIPDDLPEDVTVHFAEHDPVRIRCEQGRLQLTIRLQELDHAGTNVWKNFEVRGYYRPSDNQLEANLVRDGNLELVGERLRLGDQIALRGIFAKVLSRNRQLSIVNKQILARPQLADLQVTQFVVQDGWIGVALGPKSDNLRPPPRTADEEIEVTRQPLRNAIRKLR